MILSRWSKKEWWTDNPNQTGKLERKQGQKLEALVRHLNSSMRQWLACVFYMSLPVTLLKQAFKNSYSELDGLHLKRENTSDIMFPNQHLLPEENISEIGCVFSELITRSKKVLKCRHLNWGDDCKVNSPAAKSFKQFAGGLIACRLPCYSSLIAWNSTLSVQPADRVYHTMYT